MNAEVIIFIIGIPVIEIYLMIKVGHVIGALNTIFLFFLQQSLEFILQN